MRCSALLLLAVTGCTLFGRPPCASDDDCSENAVCDVTGFCVRLAGRQPDDAGPPPADDAGPPPVDAGPIDAGAPDAGPPFRERVCAALDVGGANVVVPASGDLVAALQDLQAGQVLRFQGAHALSAAVELPPGVTIVGGFDAQLNCPADDNCFLVHSDTTLTAFEVHGGAANAAIEVAADSSFIRVHDVQFVDTPRGVFTRHFNNGAGHGVDDIVVSCIDFRYSDDARGDGLGCEIVDAVHLAGAQRATVRDSRFDGVFCSPDLGGNAVLVTHTARDVVVERNLFLNARFAVRLGNTLTPLDSRAWDPTPCGVAPMNVYGAVVRNNLVLIDDPDLEEIAQEALVAWRGCDVDFVHNTVLYRVTPRPTAEVRDAASEVRYRNNFMSGGVTTQNSPAVLQEGNLEDAALTDFRDPDGRDLHLAPGSRAVDRGEAVDVGLRETDIDGEPVVDEPDVGADEAG